MRKIKKKRAHVGGTKMLSACCWTWIFVADSSLSLREGGKKKVYCWYEESSNKPKPESDFRPAVT